MAEQPPAPQRAAAQAGGAPRLVDLAQVIGVAGAEETAKATVGRRHGATGASVRPAFDGHHPPSAALISDCVHCGFCLPSCPTYLLFGEEMDSPRGRIYLMKEGLEGEALNDAMARHFDLCLGCLACVTACPSGVQYEKLIEATRQQVERRYGRPASDRIFRETIYRLFPYPRRLQLLLLPLLLYQRSGLQAAVQRWGILDSLPPRLRTLLEVAPDVPRGWETIPAWVQAYGRERMRVGMLLGCVQRAFFPHVNAATVRVLAAEGCSIATPPRQGCCGALSAHAGREEEAIRFARRTIVEFERLGVNAVAVNVAGCGSHMKEFGYLLRDDPAFAERAKRFSALARDVSELLDENGPVAERHPLPLTAVYHDACHLQHGQGIRGQPRAVLAQIPDLVLREVPREREICCGSAGTYNLLEPDAARALGDRKARAILAAGAQVLVTGNPGCQLQIGASLRRMGVRMPAVHVMELVDASIHGLPAESLTARG